MKAVKVRYRHSVVNLYGIFSCPYLRLGLVRFQPPKAQEIRDMDKAHAMQRTHQQELLRMREHKARIDTEREKEIERRLEGGYDEIELSLIRFKSFLEDAENHATRGEYQEVIKDFNAAMAIKPDYLPLDDRARELQQLLKEQSQPVELVFSSDGRT